VTRERFNNVLMDDKLDGTLAEILQQCLPFTSDQSSYFHNSTGKELLDPVVSRRRKDLHEEFVKIVEKVGENGTGLTADDAQKGNFFVEWLHAHLTSVRETVTRTTIGPAKQPPSHGQKKARVDEQPLPPERAARVKSKAQMTQMQESERSVRNQSM